MYKKILIAFIFMTALFFPMANSFSEELAIDNVTRPEKDKGPTKVEVELYVLDIDNVDTAMQNFDMNLFFRIGWHDPRLAGLNKEKVNMPLEKIWHPHLQFINQQRVWYTFDKNVDIYPSGDVIYSQRLWGSFSQPLELRDFPFDKQTFNAILVPAGYNSDEVQLVSGGKDISGIASRFSVADWEILGWSTGPWDPQMPGRRANNNAYAMTIEAQRHANFFVLQLIVPLIFIVMMAWTVFWIDPQQSGTQIMVSVTAMLTLIAFRFTAGVTLPRFDYLTRLDYFILASTIQVFASLVEVITSSWLARRNKLALARRLDKISRWVFPISFAILAYITLF